MSLPGAQDLQGLQLEYQPRRSRFVVAIRYGKGHDAGRNSRPHPGVWRWQAEVRPDEVIEAFHPMLVCGGQVGMGSKAVKSYVGQTHTQKQTQKDTDIRSSFEFAFSLEAGSFPARRGKKAMAV